MTMRFSRCFQVQKIPMNIVAGFFALAAASALVMPGEAFAKSAQVKPGTATALKNKDRQPELSPSGTAQLMAGWVLDSGDNIGRPFVIIDKPAAKAFVYSRDGQLLGAAWVLVGLATGDDSLPGIGTMPLSAIRPEMRTTPAGRFVASFGHDLETEVLWVDYDNAISLHRVINTTPSERRLQRIVSPTPRDHRVSFGCINVPAKFFDAVVEPTFQQEKGIVYILPDAKPLQAVFPTFYEVKTPAVDGGSKSQPGQSQALVARDGVN